jgi:hypothetical protein
MEFAGKLDVGFPAFPLSALVAVGFPGWETNLESNCQFGAIGSGAEYRKCRGVSWWLVAMVARSRGWWRWWRLVAMLTRTIVEFSFDKVEIQ